MGRRPNPLVSEFFTRGSKLQDSSNRYEHTCKLCGENFPKGRADSLLSHLVKSCQAIPAADKERVIHQAHVGPASGSKRTYTNARSDRGKGTSFPYPSTTNGAFNTIGSLNGLNVLAEASRRVGASDDKQPGDSTIEHSVGDTNVLVDPALESSLKGGVDSDFHAAFVTSPPTSQYFPNTAESTLSMHLAPNGLPDTTPDARQTSQLSMIAASANEMVTQDGAGSLDVVDVGSRRPFSTSPISVHNMSDFDADFPGSAQRPALFPRPIAINPSSQSNGFLSTPSESSPPAKHKSRAPFSEERRKEVQYVRKKGACLRCRILKKTCSIDEPCRQCKSLQNPRVWSEYCIRDRISTKLESYTAGLHSTLVYHETNKIKNQIHFEHSAGRIEIMHFETDIPNILTFSLLRGRRPVPTGVVSELSASPNGSLGMQTRDVYILDGDTEEWGTKLDFYMQKMAQQFIDAEPTNFIKQTVSLAWELRQLQENDLLNDALKLWIATCILADPFLNWRIFYNETLPPTTLHPLSTISNESRIPIDDLTDIESFNLICSQLRGAIEKRAAKVGKSLMNKVEERMLKRGSAGHFGTFLATLILLNCAERMSWLFHTWDNTHNSQRWPLERRPADFASEGERFSGVVIMHLNMRKIASVYTVEPETGLLRGREGRDPMAIQWFNSVNVTSEYLQQRQAAAFDPGDMRSFDLKYCSRLF